MEPYVLGHTARERDRLDLQGQLYHEATRRSFENAGMGRGMRVLDVGCGSGDVTRVASEIVGDEGVVHGIDRDADTITDAKRRSTAAGCTNVFFSVGEIGDDLSENSYDALVGRFVLMHQANPADVVKRLVRALKPRSIVVFLESHMLGLRDGIHSCPRSQVYDTLVRWKCRVVAAAGADLEAGMRLRQVFCDAGLPAPSMRVEAPVVGGAHSDYYRYMAESVRSMLPQAQLLGIEGVDDRSVDRIETELRNDVVGQDGILVAWPVVAAWCRLA